jgi:hypothetical protein
MHTQKLSQMSSGRISSNLLQDYYSISFLDDFTTFDLKTIFGKVPVSKKDSSKFTSLSQILSREDVIKSVSKHIVYEESRNLRFSEVFKEVVI